MIKIINHHTGIMEEETTLGEVINKLVEKVESGRELRAILVPKSKHHNGKPMIVISEKPLWLSSCNCEDCTIYHIEISEDGIFPYIFDDSIS